MSGSLQGQYTMRRAVRSRVPTVLTGGAAPDNSHARLPAPSWTA
ncbi:MAG TPA: hypothetical protein VG099_20855 [Gemmataceae bacterium]|nr:hypothetical protein [Gemmataceae bacterium]